MKSSIQYIAIVIIYFAIIVGSGYLIGLCAFEKPVTAISIICTTVYIWHFMYECLGAVLKAADAGIREIKLLLPLMTYITTEFFLTGLLIQRDFKI